ncbi:MAG: tRNA (adenine-N1)-methyltransferase [Actinomycetaceae bacterium]|nr:tRNA (adenine-N1)-methyltransferase [Actinomycetaceae bacterium]
MNSSLEYPVPSRVQHPLGQASRRGPLRAGEHVQITDPKGRLHTVMLVPGGQFHSARGSLNHDDIIGQPEAVTLFDGEREFQVVRPLQTDYVMSMPRGAAIVYPKDAAQIVAFGDIFPGARVLEAGVGSGALSMSLLQAVGTTGHVHSIERRADFAKIAQGNVDLWFGGRHPAWEVSVADFNEVALALEPESVDRIVLDMLAPWECLEAVEHALVPGGVLTVYVATVTQLSRLHEDVAGTRRFTRPQVWESSIRTWHLDGLAVRPDHRMVAHTGFLFTARKVARKSVPQQRGHRPAKAAEGLEGQWNAEDDWEDNTELNPVVSQKKVRRSIRDVSAKSREWLSHEDSEPLSLEDSAGSSAVNTDKASGDREEESLE